MRLDYTCCLLIVVELLRCYSLPITGPSGRNAVHQPGSDPSFASLILVVLLGEALYPPVSSEERNKECIGSHVL